MTRRQTAAEKAVEAALFENWEDSEFDNFTSSNGGPNFDALAKIAAQAAIDSLFPKDVVVACRKWTTNAELIYDAWKLGYVTGHVYDLTPGNTEGLWSRRLWRTVASARMPGEDIAPLPGIERILGNHDRSDFRHQCYPDGYWDTVFYDPPYRLAGNPDGLPELNARFGINIALWQDRHRLIVAGFQEALRISNRFVLAKVQDQVVSGHIRWQTDMLKQVADGGTLNEVDHGWDEHFDITGGHARLVDRFDMIGHSIQQPMGKSKRYPKGRKQKHAHARPSTLLVFEKTP